MIRPGDVPMMSAGTGVRHSEYKASRAECVHFLQLWIVPDRTGVAPHSQQRHFAAGEKRGKLRLIISPDGTEGSLSVHQDARVYAGLFDGDAVKPRKVRELEFASGEDAEVLLFDLRPTEIPHY